MKQENQSRTRKIETNNGEHENLFVRNIKMIFSARQRFIAEQSVHNYLFLNLARNWVIA